MILQKVKLKNSPMTEAEKQNIEEPPVFRSWKGWYWLVFISLVVMIVLLYLFSMAFS